MPYERGSVLRSTSDRSLLHRVPIIRLETTLPQPSLRPTSRTNERVTLRSSGLAAVYPVATFHSCNRSIASLDCNRQVTGIVTVAVSHVTVGGR